MNAKLLDTVNVAMTSLETALALHECGLWPIPIYPRGVNRDGRLTEGKEPIGGKWGMIRNTPETLHSRFIEFPKAGVGLGLGPGRGPNGEWLADVEGDGPEAEESRLRLFEGEAVETLGWSSVRGCHQLVTADQAQLINLLKPLKGLEGKGLKTGVYHLPDFPGLEIRFGGFKSDGAVKQIQSVVPPTVGTDGTVRQWNGVTEIAPAPASLYAALARAAAGKSAPAGPDAAVSSNGTGGADRKLGNLDDASLAADALRSLESSRCDDYQSWFEVGCSLHKLGQVGLALWDQWSQSSPKYQAGVCAEKWATMTDEGITLGSLFAWASRAGWKHPGGKSGRVSHGREKQAEPAARNGQPPVDPPVKARAAKPPGRVPIEVNTQRHLVLADTLAVLPNDPGLFCRGNALVKIAEPCEEDEDKLPGGVVLRKARGSVRITPMGEAGLSCRLTAVADFFTWFKDKNGEGISKPVHPPPWLVKAVIEHSEYRGVRPLEGVAEVPFPRPDGTLVMTPGYDPVTGFYYAPTIAIGPVPDRPSQADAKASASLLLALVEQFPFSTSEDRPVWLAFVLTVIARPAITGPVPGIAFNGNKAGTGKGKLIDAGSTIASGRAVPTTAYPKDEAEAEKIKVAFALAGTPIAHLDNIDEGRSYGGGVIDSALTSTECGGRILGFSKNVEGIVLRTIWCLSGNNISPVKDAFRRWLVCNLVTRLERPEERGDLDIPDLAEYVQTHRAELVRAALVILRAHAVAGRPNGGWAPLGSYEQWDRIVRGAVWYATGLDCNATRRKAAEDSPDRQNKLALLEAWKELPHGGHGAWGVSSEEAFKMAFGDKDVAPTHPGLGDVLIRFSRDGKVSVRNIGFIIRGMKGQNVNGMTFLTDRDHKRSALWHVDTDCANNQCFQKTTQNVQGTGEFGEYGEYPPRLPHDAKERIIIDDVRSATELARLEPYSPNSPNSPPEHLLQSKPDCDCLRLECPVCNPSVLGSSVSEAIRYLHILLYQGPRAHEQVLLDATDVGLAHSDIEAAAVALNVQREIGEDGHLIWRLS